MKRVDDVCSCTFGAGSDGDTAPNENPPPRFNAPNRCASCTSVKSALSWNDNALTTPYTRKEQSEKHTAGAVDKRHTDAHTRGVPHKCASLCTSCEWRRNLKRPAVLLCCAVWFVLSFVLAILLVLYSRGSLAGR